MKNVEKIRSVNKLYATIIVMSIILVIGACGKAGDDLPEQGEDETGVIPEVTLNFALEPYPDHTDSIIAIEKDWFSDVGITIKDSMVDAEKIPSVLTAGTVDIASVPPASLIPSLKQEDFQGFVFGNLFRGYAIMAQPDAGYKDFNHFIEQGLSADEAIEAVVHQMKGKVFTYPSETGVRPFIDLAFSKANMTLDEVTTDVQQDSNGISLMLAKRADFKVGGVPSRLTLESEGMIPILTSADIVEAAEPSGDSVEIRSILHNGWVTTKEYSEKNHDTLLRMASVRFRLNQFLTDNQQEAAEIHIPYLNKQAGTDFTIEEGIVLYDSQMPWYTFEEQASWFEDEADPLFWRYEFESNIKMYEEEGIFDEGEFDAEDIITAHKIYAELKEYKEKTEENMNQLTDASGRSLELKEIAEKHYDIFNYLDSYRISNEAIEEMNR